VRTRTCITPTRRSSRGSYACEPASRSRDDAAKASTHARPLASSTPTRRSSRDSNRRAQTSTTRRSSQGCDAPAYLHYAHATKKPRQQHTRAPKLASHLHDEAEEATCTRTCTVPTRRSNRGSETRTHLHDARQSSHGIDTHARTCEHHAHATNSNPRAHLHETHATKQPRPRHMFTHLHDAHATKQPRPQHIRAHTCSVPTRRRSEGRDARASITPTYKRPSLLRLVGAHLHHAHAMKQPRPRRRRTRVPAATRGHEDRLVYQTRRRCLSQHANSQTVRGAAAAHGAAVPKKVRVICT